MGSMIELNDTLQITTEQGFPKEIFDRESHVKKPVTLKDVQDKIFAFHDKPNPRIYQLDPVRVYLVHNIGGKWLFWGRIFIQSLEIALKNGKWITGGTYKMVDVYDPYYQEVFTARESPPGSNYFCP